MSNFRRIFSIAGVVAMSAILVGCQQASFNGKSLPELVRGAADNFDQYSGFVLVAKDSDGKESMRFEYDGTNTHIVGEFEGTMSDMYTVGGVTYMYIDAGLGEQWYKLNEDGLSTQLDQAVTEINPFKDEDLEDSTIKNSFEYVGETDCPGDLGGTCFEFAVTTESGSEKSYIDVETGNFVYGSFVDEQGLNNEFTIYYGDAPAIVLPEGASTAQEIN